jgi:hypothetical protein
MIKWKIRGLFEREIKEDVIIHNLANKVLDSKYYKIIKVFGIVIYRYNYEISNDNKDKTINDTSNIGFIK